MVWYDVIRRKLLCKSCTEIPCLFRILLSNIFGSLSGSGGTSRERGGGTLRCTSCLRRNTLLAKDSIPSRRCTCWWIWTEAEAEPR
jgi:hypothetical protein